MISNYAQFIDFSSLSLRPLFFFCDAVVHSFVSSFHFSFCFRIPSPTTRVFVGMLSRCIINVLMIALLQLLVYIYATTGDI